MSLEALVPPLELCQKLKPEDFPESVLVWCRVGISNPQYRVAARSPKRYHNPIPAPTLAEILEVLPRFSEPYGVPILFINSKSIGYENPIENIGIDDTEHDENLADAALRLWLRQKGREVSYES